MLTGLSGDHKTFYDGARPGSVRHAARGFFFDREAAYLTEGTLSSYERKMRAWITWLDEQGVEKAAELRVEHISGYFAHLREAGRKASGIHAEARVIRAFMRWADSEGLTAEGVAHRIKMPKTPKQVSESFTLEQIDALLKAAHSTTMPERDTAMLLLLLDTGIRATELCTIRDDDIQGDMILVTGKGRKERWVRMSARTRKALWAWTAKRREDAEWLFLSRYGTQLTRFTVNLLFRRLARMAGVDERCYPHKARHTVAIEALRSGMGAFELQRMLGHESISTTQRYVGMTGEDVRRAHTQHGLVDRLGKKRR
jgi:integrase/recombinase XerD